MRVFGFTLIRNGVKYDYPFMESLHSLSLFTEKIFLALGQSDDGTEKLVGSLPYLHIIPTQWDEKLREGGLILSQQTNVALQTLREGHGEDPHNWGFYLQGDEVVHEAHRQQILEDLQRADQAGCDAIRFRFLHFWQDHHHIAINKKWYPSEIRAVRLKTGIESWGDAQSFRHASKIYDSDVPIFHYGHVREKDSYLKKKADILRLYHPDNLLSKYRRREKRYDRQTECLLYFATHPQCMKKRIEKYGGVWMLPEVPEVGLVIKEPGQRGLFPENFLQKIHARKIHIESDPKNLSKFLPKERIIIWRPNLLEKFFYHENIPHSMRSKLARPWPPEFVLMLQLSHKGVGMRGSF